MAMAYSTLSTGLAGKSFAPLRSSRQRQQARRVIPARAEKSLGEKIEEKVDDIAKAASENSGLDLQNLNEQPGNTSKSALGEVKTPKGDISEVLSFSGLLPEMINSRAAMLGMLAAFGAELSTREPILKQIQYAPVPIAAAFIAIVIGSLAPVVRNANLEIDGSGPFTRKAEVVNGRIAMVAFALTIAVETWKAGPGLVP